MGHARVELDCWSKHGPGRWAALDKQSLTQQAPRVLGLQLVCRVSAGPWAQILKLDCETLIAVLCFKLEQ